MSIEQQASPFLKLALKYRSVVKAGLEHGLTSKRRLDAEGNFRAVGRHELVVAAVCDTLGRAIGLDEATQDTLNTTALVHDVNKKFEYRPHEFTSEQSTALGEFIQSQDGDLMAATKEKFVDEHKDNIDALSLPQMLLYYADMIVSWDRITPFRDRIAESRARRPELSDEFFDTEIRFGESIQQRIFDRLPDKMKEKIGDPSQIPHYLIESLK
jgi:hypothetical protein